MTQKIRKAIIIHGPGRSGTTLLSHMLSLHPELFWISGWVNRFPDHPELGFFNRLQYPSNIESLLRNKRFLPRPAEAYGFWDHFFPGFRKGKVEDLNKGSVKKCISTINKLNRFAGHSRFVTKITGMPRSNVLDAVFEDPVVVWIDRDPMAVIMSFYKQRWNYKSKPDLFKSKSFNELADEYLQMYLRFQEGKKDLESKFRVITVQYEDLLSDASAFFVKLQNDLGLKEDEGFSQKVKEWNIKHGSNISHKRSMNKKNAQYLKQRIESALP